MPDSMHGKTWYGAAFATVLVLLLLVSVTVRWRLDPVTPLGADAPSTEFSAGRAAKALATVLGDQQPHPVDSPSANGVRERITSTLAGLGYQVEVQDTTSCRQSRFTTCARVRNLIAVREGSPAGQAILLSAHYDSVPAGPGANDAGSAVGALLEVARLLKGRPAGRNAVILLFNEGEEAGLLGAEAFVAQHRLASKVAVAINIEARGASGQSVMFETGDKSGWLVDAFSSSSKRPLTNSLLYEAYRLMPNDTDLTVYKAKGLQGLNFAHGEQLPYYHTPMDNLEQVDLGSLQQHGDNAYGLVESLVDADLKAGNAGGNKVYTDILGLTVIHWPTSWGLAIADILVALFVFAAWRLKKLYPYPVGSAVRGLLSFPLSLVAGAVAAYALTYLLALFNGGMTPWHSGTLANRLLLWAAVLLAVLSVQRLLARKTSPVGFWVGLGLPWLLMAALTSIKLPGTSYLFVLPSAALVVAALFVPWLAGRLGEKALPALFALPALVAYLAILPTVYLIEIMLGFNALVGVIGMGVLLALAATFFGPLVGAKPVTKAHRVARYALVVVVAVSAALSLRAPAYTTTQPQPLNVIYLQDSAGKAHVLAGNQYQVPPAKVMEAMGKQVALEPKLPWSQTRQYNATVASLGLPSAGLTIISQTATAKGREVVARINAGPSAQKIMMILPENARLASVEMDGKRVEQSAMARAVPGYDVFVCQGESCDGKQIRLVLHSREPLPGLLARITAGVPDKLKAITQSRGEQAIPFGDGDQSIVVSGIRL
jgi:hypothetical protein